MSKAYDFYQLMWYPTPYYKEFFAYLETVPHLWWGQKIDVSRWKFNQPLLDLQQQQREIQLLWAKQPFIEGIYITGDTSANAVHTDSIDLRVVVSVWRYYLWYIWLKCRMAWKNIRRKHNQKPVYNILTVQSEDNLAVPVKWLQDDPVWIWYMMLHLIPLYIKYENNATRIYDENPRLSSYFPQFPGQSLIWSWCQTVMWSHKTKEVLENILSGYFWIFCDACMYICYHIYARCSRNRHEYFLSSSYRKFPDQYESILLKRKAMWKR